MVCACTVCMCVCVCERERGVIEARFVFARSAKAVSIDTEYLQSVVCVDELSGAHTISKNIESFIL